MFAISGHRLPSCDSYEGAKSVWAKATPFHDSEDQRGLVNKYERDKAVFMQGDDVCFRYHQTVLVRWINAHTLSIRHHDSVSSRTFINRFLPRGLAALSLGGTTTVNCVEPANYYTMWRFQPDKNVWEVDENTALIREDVVVDRKIAAQARKKLAPYREWRQVVENLKGSTMLFPQRVASSYVLNGLRDILNGPGIAPADFWGMFNVEDLDAAAAAALGAVTTKEIGPYQIPGKSKYRKFMSFVQES